MSIRIPAWRIHFWPIADTGISTHQGIAIILTVTTVISLTIFLKRATLGLAIRAAAENFPVTQLMGIRANRVVATAFHHFRSACRFCRVFVDCTTGLGGSSYWNEPDHKGFYCRYIRRRRQPVGRCCRGPHSGFYGGRPADLSSGRRTAFPRCHRVHGGRPGIATLAERPYIDPPKKRLSAHADSMTVL